MSQYIIVKVNTDEEMNLRFEQDFENYDGLYVPVSDKPRYEKIGELIRCKDCKFYVRNDKKLFHRGSDCLKGIIDTIVPDKDFCSKAERKER